MNVTASPAASAARFAEFRGGIADATNMGQKALQFLDVAAKDPAHAGQNPADGPKGAPWTLPPLEEARNALSLGLDSLEQHTQIHAPGDDWFSRILGHGRAPHWVPENAKLAYPGGAYGEARTAERLFRRTAGQLRSVSLSSQPVDPQLISSARERVSDALAALQQAAARVPA